MRQHRYWDYLKFTTVENCKKRVFHYFLTFIPPVESVVSHSSPGSRCALLQPRDAIRPRKTKGEVRESIVGVPVVCADGAVGGMFQRNETSSTECTF
jgi:hypothetical protein